MFDLRANPTVDNCFERPTYVSQAALFNQAITLFNQARWDSQIEVCKSFLLRRATALFELESLPQNCVRNRRYGGIKPVSLGYICGTLGRTGDFDQHFHPLSDRIRDRWVSIAMARSQNTPLEPVELIQVGKRYFVKDGHHRLSVAHARGETAIDAEIIIWEVACALPWETQPAAYSLPQIA